MRLVGPLHNRQGSFPPCGWVGVGVGLGLGGGLGDGAIGRVSGFSLLPKRQIWLATDGWVCDGVFNVANVPKASLGAVVRLGARAFGRLWGGWGHFVRRMSSTVFYITALRESLKGL